jgi:hypothetical protein
MSPLRRLAAVLAISAPFMGVAACDDDGKTAPERCLDPALPLFDPHHAGAPADDNEQYPCVTPVGHAVSYVGNAPSNTAGSSTTTLGGAGGEGGGSANGGGDGGGGGGD